MFADRMVVCPKMVHSPSTAWKRRQDMALIQTVSPDQAQGPVKEAYEMFMKNIGMIPKPMEMMSVSPPLFELNYRRIQYFSKHPNLSFPLLAHIRYLVAHHLNYPFCTDFNKFVLKKQGVDDETLRKMEMDPAQSLLEANESAMLTFVVRAVKDPSSVSKEDIEKLKNLGWQDRDIFDALSQGVSMIDHSIMMQVFQIDQNCMVG